MNERIKELAKQCYETGPIGRDGWPEYSHLNETKFAELIVLECAVIVGSMEEPHQDIAKLIKQHFGVER